MAGNNSDSRSSVPGELQNGADNQVAIGDSNGAEITSVPGEPGFQDKDDDQDDIDLKANLFRVESDIFWSIICGFLNNLSEQEISAAKDHFCNCVNSIIKAYEEKAQEAKFWKDLLKRKTKEKNKKIKELEHCVSELTKQLDSKVCEKCGKKGISEQFRSLSVNENTKGKTEIDGPQVVNMDNRSKGPLENEEATGDKTDTGKSRSRSTPNVRCPYAFCGFVSLLCLLHEKGIYFCAIKLLLKLGAETDCEPPSCTKILNNLHELRFLKRVYKCPDVDQVGRDETLKIAANELKLSGQKAGLLSYSTDDFSHCLTVYLTEKEGELEIHDADENVSHITDFENVNILELIVLRCDRNGEPLIVKEWGDQCHKDICEYELRRLKSDYSTPNAVMNGDNRNGAFREDNPADVFEDGDDQNSEKSIL
ncbi:uncharacterized protein LOC114534501 [Dendronephthya gigantea]|uniref:uncharacterized protein LOC114534501 n=1 Tax=Dendronephthya gigantea TaxID=151771 RepID=UPI00106937C4|nr:uncharacterized protein LOC114534501 [Dendronephthya gigantea]XP_028411754.1 uncharacterized protein LOC114534501 [Dendronephthya gigantea]XP_028411755.1 uncharacterized protein LOC114534501 [Dendronephthya gigantea]